MRKNNAPNPLRETIEYLIGCTFKSSKINYLDLEIIVNP